MQQTRLIEFYGAAETAPLPIQHTTQPTRIGWRGAIEAESAKLERDHCQRVKRAALPAQCRQIHEHEVAAKGFVACDALVVRDEVAASVQDQPTVVDFDGLAMVR